MSDAEPTLAEYLAARRLPVNTWGDFVRTALRDGTFPDVKSWPELRSIVEHHAGIDIVVKDAKVAWTSYQSMLRTARLKRARGDEPSSSADRTASAAIVAT